MWEDKNEKLRDGDRTGERYILEETIRDIQRGEGRAARKFWGDGKSFKEEEKKLHLT